MAYMNQERKKAMAPKIKEILRKYGMKGTLSVWDHSTLVLNITSGKIDFGEDRIQVNHYWINDHYTGDARNFLNEVKDAMNIGNHDNSDVYTDYFDVGWYIDINIGRWDKPYIVI